MTIQNPYVPPSYGVTHTAVKSNAAADDAQAGEAKPVVDEGVKEAPKPLNKAARKPANKAAAK